MARRPATGWGHTPGWAQAFPGWTPLDDPGPLPLRAASSVGRWWWPISAIVGFLAVVAFVSTHDPHPGLSDRGWLTVVLAAIVVVLLSIHRASHVRPPRAPLARAIVEYAVVALLAVLLATAGSQAPAPHVQDGAGTRQSTEQPAQRQPAEQDRRQPAEHADAGTADRRPGIVRAVTGVWGWFAQLWRDAGEQASRSAPPTSTTPKEGP